MEKKTQKIIAEENANIWLKDPFDEHTRDEVRKLKQNDFSLFVDCFSQQIDFGTGGLRALLGLGPNRMNVYTVLKVTRGLIAYAQKRWSKKISIVVGYDGRHGSEEFAQNTSALFAQYGMDVFLLPQPTPTPMVSFLVRELQACLGVMITASHNPKDYNGYKIYDQDGGQVAPPVDKEIMKHVAMVTEYCVVEDVAAQLKKVTVLDAAIYQKYFDATEKVLRLCAKDVEEESKKLEESKSSEKFSMLYTPLHGVGGALMSEAMQRIGVDFAWVDAQKNIDPDFPTIAMPNPEEDDSLALAMTQWKKNKSSLLIATDADADRMRVGVYDGQDFHLLSGNQMAVLLVDYYLSALKKNNQLPADGYVAKTIVTSEMVACVAEHYGVPLLETLPGFKYIGALIEKNKKKFLVGVEDSCGYLVGDHLRDKDGIQAALFACRMVLHWQKKGKSLVTRLRDLYAQFGFFQEKILSLQKNDPSLIADLMQMFRKNNLRQLSGMDLVSLWDVQKGTKRSFDFLGEVLQEENILFDTADVLVFSFQDSLQKKSLTPRFLTIVVRPSGTEPKIKFYVQLRSQVFQESSQKEWDSWMQQEKIFFEKIEKDFFRQLP